MLDAREKEKAASARTVDLESRGRSLASSTEDMFNIQERDQMLACRIISMNNIPEIEKIGRRTVDMLDMEEERRIPPGWLEEQLTFLRCHSCLY